MIRSGQPQIHFREEDRSDWEPKLRLYASRNLRDNDIAHAFGLTHSGLVQNHEVMHIVREEKAAYRYRIESEIYQLAMYNENDFGLVEDAAERAMMRKQKLEALKVLHNVMHKDPFIPPAETERLSRLSDAQLKAELEKQLSKFAL